MEIGKPDFNEAFRHAGDLEYRRPRHKPQKASPREALLGKSWSRRESEPVAGIAVRGEIERTVIPSFTEHSPYCAATDIDHGRPSSMEISLRQRGSMEVRTWAEYILVRVGRVSLRCIALVRLYALPSMNN